MQVRISNIINRINKHNKSGYIYSFKVRHLEYVINYSFIRIFTSNGPVSEKRDFLEKLQGAVSRVSSFHATYYVSRRIMCPRHSRGLGAASSRRS